jgi:hypothetical protein
MLGGDLRAALDGRDGVARRLAHEIAPRGLHAELLCDFDHLGPDQEGLSTNYGVQQWQTFLGGPLH